MMNAEQIILNIAVNLGRLSRFSMEGREERVRQFLADTEKYLNLINKSGIDIRFKPTLEHFKQEFYRLKSKPLDRDFAEDTLTWANILQHRARLASPAKRAKLA